MRSKKITQAAKGEQCTLQIAGVCNGNPETTVFCHFPDSSHGVGIKATDFSGGFGCSACHDVVDGRVRSNEFQGAAKDWYMRRSQTRTMERLFERGILCIK